jgi:hypothetical protein
MMAHFGSSGGSSNTLSLPQAICHLATALVNFRKITGVMHSINGNGWGLNVYDLRFASQTTPKPHVAAKTRLQFSCPVVLAS